MSTSPSALFTGTSTYSQDFQNIISQQVQIASLPITLLQNNVTTLTSQSSELQTLSSKFTTVQTAIANLATAASQPLAAISSNSAVGVTLGTGAVPASYSIGVDDLGSYSDALSLDNGLPKVTDPGTQSLSSSGTYTLTVNGQTYSGITPAGNTLNALADAINDAGAGVQATVINVSSGSTPDYRLSLQSTQYGSVSMQLNDGTRDLLSSTQDGTPVSYTLNGKALTSGSRTLTLASGLTVNLTGTTDSPATVTVAPSSSGISNALQSFVTAYNAAVDELNNNRGQATGALVGQSIISTLTDSLRSLVNYSVGTDGISSLYSLGLGFPDDTGHLSLDTSVFADATSGSLDAVTQFLGSPDTSGFLQMATDTLNGIEDPTTGTLPMDISSTLSEISSVNQQISDKQDQVSQLQTNLTQQMAAADALIASMQQQAIYFNNMFTAMQDAEIGQAYQ